MRIRRLKVDNLRGLENFALDLCDEAGKPRPLTVLVGPNMSGKTSVLDALHLASAVVADPGRRSFRDGFDPGRGELRRRRRDPISVEVEFSLHDGEWEAIDGLGWGPPGMTKAGVQPPKCDVYSFTMRWPMMNTGVWLVSSDPANAHRAFGGRAAARRAKDERRVAEGALDLIGGVLYLDQHRSVHVGGPFTATDREWALREAAGGHDVLPWLELQSRLDVKWDPQTQGESSWKRVKRLFKDLAAPAEIDDIEPSDEGFDLRLKRGGVKYFSAAMSSGEQQLLRFVTNLVSQRATRSVVLIDEIELHLHPAWQRDLLHFCQRGGGDDNQFIVTTHSESILRFVDPACVVSLGDLLTQRT